MADLSSTKLQNSGIWYDVLLVARLRWLAFLEEVPCKTMINILACMSTSIRYYWPEIALLASLIYLQPYNFSLVVCLGPSVILEPVLSREVFHFSPYPNPSSLPLLPAYLSPLYGWPKLVDTLKNYLVMICV